MKKNPKTEYDGFCSSDVADQLYLNMLQLQLRHKVQLHSTSMKSMKRSWKIYNCSTMRGYVCIEISSSSIQISPRFLFSSKLYLGLLSQNPYVTWLHTAEAYAALYRVSTIKVSERTLTSIKEKYKYSAPLRHWAWHLLPVSFNWWPKPAAFTARRY